jgi:ornithine decarboxylase
LPIQAIERVRAAIVDAAVTVDIVDVGGGFPSIYPGMEPPPLEDYFGAIHRAFESLPVSYSSELWCEPGRALCAEYNSLIVRVEKGRGEELYINDGAYGAFYDAAHVGWRFPVKCLSEGRSEVLAPYASTARPVTMPTIWKGPSCCPPIFAPATISRSGCWGPMARRCGRGSTALAMAR